MDCDRLAFERELWRQGCVRVAGVDEVGRGPLAGPVTAAAVILPAGWGQRDWREELAGLNDSKQLTEARREQFYAFIIRCPEIEYALGNLDSNKVYAWTAEDHQISQLMQSYFANFIKSGNPNGPGLPEWPEMAGDERQIIDLNPRWEAVGYLRPRYEFLEQNPSRE